MTAKPKHAFSLNFKKIKIFLLGLSLVGCFVLVLARLFSIQIAHRDFYLKKLNRQYEMTYTNGSVIRGEIYDRNGVELAASVLSYSLYVNKTKIADVAAFSNDLAACTGMAADVIRRRVESSETAGFFLLRKQEDMKLKSQLVAFRRENRKGVSDAVEIVEESKRIYPYRELASHVLGFANEDNEGLEGIEYFYDKKIRGDMEKAGYSRDVANGIVRRGRSVREGSGIELTLDRDIQAIAEDELKKGVLKSRARSGFAIVMDPETGEILAISSYPTFDPNRYAEFSPGARKNRAVLDVMEPGSVMKVFLMAATLEERVLSPASPLYCENGRYKVHDRVFKEAHMKRYGTLTFKDVMKFSSNIGCIKAGEKLGKKKLHQYLTEFGFGRKTELGFTGESRGIVPSLKELTPVRLSTVSFGQGISASPVQVATAFCAVVNGGNLLKPLLVKKVLNEEGVAVLENQKEIVRRVISPRTSEAVRSVLQEVVTDGTGREARIDGVTVLGKTGTAQKAGRKGYTNEFFASFLGAFPVDKPRYVMYIGVDAPQGISYGGYVAAPIFREIGKRLIDLRGEERKVLVLNDEAATQTAAPSRRSGSFSNLSAVAVAKDIPDFRGLTLREALRVANLRKIQIEVSGSGVVYNQEPSSADGGARIRVYLR